MVDMPPLTSTPLMLLARHAERRAASLATVSVLVGPVSIGLALWKQHAAGRPLLASPTAESADWLHSWLQSGRARRALVAGLAERCGQPSFGRLPVLCASTDHTLATLARSLQAQAGDDPGTAFALLRALRAAEQGHTAAIPMPTSPTPASIPSARLLSLAADWCMPQRLPALVGHALPDPDAALSAVERCAQLAMRCPAWPIALCLTQSVHAACLKPPRRSRAAAWLESGRVVVGHCLSHDDVTATTAFNSPVNARERSLPDAVIPLHVQAAESLADAHRQQTSMSIERARSHAEQLLHACLEHCPETAGLSQLNVPLDIPFGPRPLEVDLLIASHRVAIEVDGYHHFRDADRYRRDRRKDRLLQLHGYLVLRVLADDVVDQLETVLSTVRDTLANRDWRPRA